MRQRNRDDDTAGVSEMKAFGEELLATGNRYIEAGKRWLNERRDEMTARNDQEAARRGPSSRSADPYPNHPADDGQERSAWLGSRADRDHDDRARGYSRDRADWDRSPIHDYGDPEIGREHAWRNEQRWQPRGTGGRGHEDSDAGFDTRPGRTPSWDAQREGRSEHGRAYGAYGSAEDGRRGRSDHLTDWGRRDHAGAHDDAPFRGGYNAGIGRSHAEHGTRAGGWRGVGPKGYARSDARITEDVCERLMDDDSVDVREVSVQVRDGVVTLEGYVHQRWIKHRIEDLVECCGGVRDVENRIRVQNHAQHADGPGAQRVQPSGAGSPGSSQSEDAGRGSSSTQGSGTGNASSGSAGSMASNATGSSGAAGGASTASTGTSAGSTGASTGASAQTSLRSEDTQR